MMTLGKRRLVYKSEKSLKDEAEKMGIDMKARIDTGKWSLERALIPRPAAYEAAALPG